tara:strand:- start:847 stop:1095 length:249 start_codon:yes stop_codon:yes gene_type:complete
MKNLQDISSDVAEELTECASDLFFEFMLELEGNELYDKYITDHGTHTTSTALGQELFMRLEDRLFKLQIPVMNEMKNQIVNK